MTLPQPKKVISVDFTPKKFLKGQKVPKAAGQMKVLDL